MHKSDDARLRICMMIAGCRDRVEGNIAAAMRWIEDGNYHFAAMEVAQAVKALELIAAEISAAESV